MEPLPCDTPQSLSIARDWREPPTHCFAERQWLSRAPGCLRFEPQVAPALIAFLLRSHSARDEHLPSIRIDLREIAIRFALFEIGFRLLGCGQRLVDGSFRLADLLIDLGSVDLGKHLAGRHAVADVDEAPLEIAVGSRQYRRFDESLYGSRQF